MDECQRREWTSQEAFARLLKTVRCVGHEKTVFGGGEGCRKAPLFQKVGGPPGHGGCRVDECDVISRSFLEQRPQKRVMGATEDEGIDLPGVTGDGLRRFDAVGNAGGVAEIDDLLEGKALHKGLDNRKSPDAGVKNTDWVVLVIDVIGLRRCCHDEISLM